MFRLEVSHLQALTILLRGEYGELLIMSVDGRWDLSVRFKC